MIDWLIDFNDMLTYLELFYAKSKGMVYILN